MHHHIIFTKILNLYRDHQNVFTYFRVSSIRRLHHSPYRHRREKIFYSGLTEYTSDTGYTVYLYDIWGGLELYLANIYYIFPQEWAIRGGMGFKCCTYSPVYYLINGISVRPVRTGKICKCGRFFLQYTDLYLRYSKEVVGLQLMVNEHHLLQHDTLCFILTFRYWCKQT